MSVVVDASTDWAASDAFTYWLEFARTQLPARLLDRADAA